MADTGVNACAVLYLGTAPMSDGSLGLHMLQLLQDVTRCCVAAPLLPSWGLRLLACWETTERTLTGSDPQSSACNLLVFSSLLHAVSAHRSSHVLAMLLTQRMGTLTHTGSQQLRGSSVVACACQAHSLDQSSTLKGNPAAGFGPKAASASALPRHHAAGVSLV